MVFWSFFIYCVYKRVFLPAFLFNKIGRCSNIKELQINEEIREREVRLIDVDGEQIGVVPIKKALDMAYDKKMDLVKVAPNEIGRASCRERV